MENKIELTLLPTAPRAKIRKKYGIRVVSTGGRKFNAARAIRIARGPF
jgi:hypothetical protein